MKAEIQEGWRRSADMVRVLAPDGSYDEDQVPDLSDEDLKRLYRFMLETRALDTRAVSLQRQGRIGFYVPSTGEEAIQVGTAFGLRPDDWFFPAYREQGAALVHGMTLREVLCQLYGNIEDLNKGRQMPNHFGCKRVNFVPTSSPVATQLPHAVGAGYAAKYRKDPVVTVAYFGDGGTSTGEFHAAMNFAGVWKTPTLFICRNNQWAISAPLAKQTASETIAIKAVAYGMPGVRADGNDVLAMYKVTQEAAERARGGSGPTLIEGVTYRMGPHSTSDDPKRYVPREALEEWQRKDPIKRFEIFLQGRDLLDKGEAEALKAEVEAELSEAVRAVEALPPQPVESIFYDVYEEMPWNLKEEMADALRWHGRRKGGG